MARNWYVGTGGADANGGTTDTNTADFSGAAGIVVTATLTEVGAFAGVPDPGVINLQDGGVSEIRTYTKVSNDAITLDSAPAGGNATYAWKIGGRRTSIKKMVTTGSGANAKLVAGDTVFVNAGTYTENAITIATRIFLIGLGGVPVIDGTGGAGGSDCLTMSGAGGLFISGIAVVNAVDRGIDATQIWYGSKVAASACGGIGMLITQNFTAPAGGCCSYMSARTCTGNGFQAFDQSANNSSGWMNFCEAGDNTGIGFGAMGYTGLSNCLAYDNAGGGYTAAPTAANATLQLINNTFEGNTGPGASVTVTNYVAGIVANNLFTNNSTYGFSSSAQFPSQGFFDYNLYFGNTTDARNNGITGTNDSTTDPQYTNAAGDDYSIKYAGGAYKTGYSPFKNPTLNKLNIGAVPGVGSGEQTGDYPAAGDVRSGTSYANGTLTGTMVASSGFLGFPLG